MFQCVCYPEFVPFLTAKLGFPGGIVVKNPLANAGDTRDSGLIPGSGRSPGVGNGTPLQYSSFPLAWKIAWTEEPGTL